MDDSVWNKNFVSKKAWLCWKTIKGKQVNPTLFKRPLNFEAVKKDFLPIVQKIERYSWTHFAQGPKGEENVTLVQELYTNWDPKKGDDIVWVRGRKVDISHDAINKHYRILSKIIMSICRDLRSYTNTTCCS